MRDKVGCMGSGPCILCKDEVTEVTMLGSGGMEKGGRGRGAMIGEGEGGDG